MQRNMIFQFLIIERKTQTMQYLSTRSHDEKAASAEAVLRGLAPDGGLYVPEAIPRGRAFGGSAAFA